MGTMITTAFKKVMIEQIVILLLSAAIIKQLLKHLAHCYLQHT